MKRILVADVTALALGGGLSNYAVFLGGSGTDIMLQDVSALAENGSGNNYGLYNRYGSAMLRGGSFTGRGGESASGIYNYGLLDAENIIALSENGHCNYGLYNQVGAAVTLRGGFFTGRGGTDARGIYNSGPLDAESVTALGEDGSVFNQGLKNTSNSEVTTLRGGSFTGRGGIYAWGIGNSGPLDAESVTALGEGGTSGNYGLRSADSAVATVRGGSFTGRGGKSAYGIHNTYSGATLEAASVTALGEGGSNNNYGLYNYDSAAAVLRGGSFTGRGGTNAYGIYNIYSGATLETEGVTALGENGSSGNYGLYNDYSATANVTQSVLEGADNSVIHASGAITVSNSRLAGGVVSGTVTCVLVTRGITVSTDGFTCP